MAEGSETPGGEAGGGHGPQGRGPGARSEGDLLAERRARRAAETGEAALTLRAEAAEATVQTLERHVASLQARLREAEDERRELSELIEAERAMALEREHELRRVKQREYAEQQLRVEAEERLIGTERESHTEIERLSVRVQAGENDTRELAHSLDDLQRQLAEAERLAAAERATGLAELRAVVERELQVRLADLERRVAETQLGLERERGARERSERLLGAVAPAGPAAGAAPRPVASTEPHVGVQPGAHAPGPAQRRSPVGVIAEARGAEMTDALAAAVERLCARAQEAPAVPEQPRIEPVTLPAHKHSMSWFARRKIIRKQRRGQ